jgi:thiol-disulfide isomerase/thioredoxin
MEPMKMKSTVALTALLVLLPALARADDDLPSEGQPAPGFNLRAMNPDVAGRPFVALDRFVGDEPDDPGCRAVLLSFFASWCAPCQKEMPYLEQLQKMYREQGLRIISVNIDKEEPGLAEAKKQIGKVGVSFPVLTDRYNLTARRYLGEQSPLPSVFIIRRDGTIARIERGYGKDAKTFLLREVQMALGLARAEHPAK